MVHEWALAESILLYIKQLGHRKVQKLRVHVGALQSIDKEVLSFAITQLAGDYGLSIESLEVVEEEPELKCNYCGYTWRLNVFELPGEVREAIHFLPEAAYAYFKCPRCGSRDFEIVRGRGLSRVEVMNPGEQPPHTRSAEEA